MEVVEEIHRERDRRMVDTVFAHRNSPQASPIGLDDDSMLAYDIVCLGLDSCFWNFYLLTYILVVELPHT